MSALRLDITSRPPDKLQIAKQVGPDHAIEFSSFKGDDADNIDEEYDNYLTRKIFKK
jgi:hypothetical protein